jgi:hypothetical protein
MRILAILFLMSLASVAAADDDTVCWEEPRDAGCNPYGCWSNGGGCNPYGCWSGPRGTCNPYGCSDVGECSAYGCPRGRVRPQVVCAPYDQVPVGDSGCNPYGCWSEGGGCNAYGCWQSAYGSCNAYGCAEVGQCNAYGCPKAPQRRRGFFRRVHSR